MALGEIGTGLSSAVTVYLNQWLKIASGGRVFLYQHTNFGSGFSVFKCSGCGDNWHVGDEHFTGTGPMAPTGIPHVLEEWVKKHRHVCTKYVNSCGGIQGTCSTCKWPFGAHEQAWLKDQTGAGQWGGYGNYSSGTYNADSFNPPSPLPKVETKTQTKTEPHKIYKGRKFRDADNEGV